MSAIGDRLKLASCCPSRQAVTGQKQTVSDLTYHAWHIQRSCSDRMTLGMEWKRYLLMFKNPLKQAKPEACTNLDLTERVQTVFHR